VILPGAQLPRQRHGYDLEVNQCKIGYSFFLAYHDDHNWRLADTIFAVSPWAVMRGAVEETPRTFRAEARAFLEQSQDFFLGASARFSANPLLYYYAFLNLGKVLLRARGLTESLDHAYHGLTEPMLPNGQRPTLRRARLEVHDHGDRVNIFPALMRKLGNPLGNGMSLPVRDLLPQVVVGHRQWRNATDGPERFIALSDIRLKYHEPSKGLWASLYVADDALSRYNIAPSRVLSEGGLNSAFRFVESDRQKHLCIELRQPVPYSSEPLDGLQELADAIRPHLWRIVSALPGDSYRRYYIHLTPPRQLGARLPQIASLWAMLFYLGSIVRYRPNTFDALIESRLGPFISEFVSAQPEQLLYLLASEMCRREIAKPAIA
jgi:hypothetical protein